MAFEAADGATLTTADGDRLTDYPRSYEDVVGLDEEKFREFAQGMRDRGHFFTPNPYKRHQLSLAHGEGHLEAYLADADEVLAEIAGR